MSLVIDRRQLLGGLALAAVPACASSHGPEPAQPATSAAPPSSTAAPAQSVLPPLDDAVFARRHDRLRAMLREAGATVAFITSGTTSFAYLAGSRVERSERLIAM